MKFNWSEQTILLTGGTGSFGKKFAEIMLKTYKPKAIRIFSRDELKQYEMEKNFNHPSLRYLLGDIRDRERVFRAMEGVTLMVHAAALKQVPACEYNPFEAIRTNILGGQNLIDGALEFKVPRTIALSTDKAVNPTNLYGATKLCMERLFVAGNSYSGERPVRFACVRYGNVIGSRGSVVPLFLDQAKNGVLTVTDKRMTRFWLTLEQGVEFVVRSIETMKGGEVFIPKIPSGKVIDLARMVGPSCKIEETGIRPGEKLHEVLLTDDEARHAVEFEKSFIVEPEHHQWNWEPWQGGKKLPEGFRYTSENNPESMSEKDLLAVIEKARKETK